MPLGWVVRLYFSLTTMRPSITCRGQLAGGRRLAIVRRSWVLPNPLILTAYRRFGVQTNGFGFIISWATNIAVVVEACTNLANPIWSPVGTNTLTDGSSYFSDPQWTNYPSAFLPAALAVTCEATSR